MNLMMLLEMAAEGMPDRVAVGSREGGITYGELFARAGAAASRFAATDGERVVLCDESSPAVPISLFGAAWAGLPYVPLNYRLPDDDLRSLAERSSPAVAIADPDGCGRLDPVAGVEAVPRDPFVDDPAGPAAGTTPGDWSMEGDDIAVLLFTSGTTGTPKSAVLRHRHLVSYILGSVEFMGAGDDEATIVSVPPYHVAGVASMLSSIYAGRRIVQLPRFDAAEWIDTVEREGVTHAMLVPTMLSRIVDELDARGGEPILGLRALSYGGGKMPSPVIRRALELFPITNFVNAYGLTETASTIAVLGPDDHRAAIASDDPAVRARLGSAGQPLPMVEVEIRDDAGNVFQGIVKMDGKPIPYAEVEVECYNRDKTFHAPTDYMVTQTIKADGNGVFTFATPMSGWWGFAALNTADYTIKHDGEDKDVEMGAVIWVYFHDWK